jgi:CRISPR-associated protein Csm3
VANQTKPILGKVVLSGNLRCLTGLHIGAQGNGGEIGGLDKPVVRDPLTREPYIPGSSLKGKLRALLERALNLGFNHPEGSAPVRHECTDRKCLVCRLMGAAGRGQGLQLEPIPSRVIVRDLRLTPESVDALSELETGLLYTEWKSENRLNRVTAAADPRHMERVPAGAIFSYELLYTVESADAEEIAVDLRHLFFALELLQDDALGGSGSRGYGKVAFEYQTIAGRKLGWYEGEKSEGLSLPVDGHDWGQCCKAVADYFAG